MATISTAGKVNTSALTGNLTASNISGVTMSVTNISVVTDIYTVPWTDYSATSTMVGWSSLTTKKIYYKKIGNMVFVNYDLRGTSNSTATNFTLPYIVTSDINFYVSGLTRNNGTLSTGGGAVEVVANSTNVNLYSNMALASWDNSAGKEVLGQFLYKIT